MTDTTRAAMLDAINEIFQDLFDDTGLQIGEDFARQDNAMWDSMNHLNILLAVGGRFGVRFSVVEVEAIKSVADIIDVLQARGAKA